MIEPPEGRPDSGSIYPVSGYEGRMSNPTLGLGFGDKHQLAILSVTGDAPVAILRDSRRSTQPGENRSRGSRERVQYRPHGVGFVRVLAAEDSLGLAGCPVLGQRNCVPVIARQPRSGVIRHIGSSRTRWRRRGSSRILAADRYCVRAITDMMLGTP